MIAETLRLLYWKTKLGTTWRQRSKASETGNLIAESSLELVEQLEGCLQASPQ